MSISSGSTKDFRRKISYTYLPSRADSDLLLQCKMRYKAATKTLQAMFDWDTSLLESFGRVTDTRVTVELALLPGRRFRKKSVLLRKGVHCACHSLTFSGVTPAILDERSLVLKVKSQKRWFGRKQLLWFSVINVSDLAATGEVTVN